MFKRILIANRGEIACRIIRSARELGVETVALYSEADATSLHVREADYAVALPGVESRDTYLKIPLITQAIRLSGADAVHPGFGFLSEKPEFARAVKEAGAVFIGPPPEAMEAMGDKISARNLMVASGVPIVPGSMQPLQTYAELLKVVKEIGYPIMLKAASGGGGRGMREVFDQSTLQESYEACRREALAYFSDDSVFCERLLVNPRHIEFQVLFDSFGNGVHLFERDCSLQRKHQKIVEEAPSTFLNEAQRHRWGDVAVKAAAHVGYVGAGTVEFISDHPERVYFMEMNTRIQVEHPVSEMITGIDLIAQQIRVAAGEKLPFAQKDLRIHGHAIEVRINAEDPAKDYLPQSGLITRFRPAMGPFVRVDTHLYEGARIPSNYDSMIAKLIAWGQTREEARKRLLRALSEFVLDGVKTNIRLHEIILNSEEFKNGECTTAFLGKNHEIFKEKVYAKPQEWSLGELADGLLPFST